MLSTIGFTDHRQHDVHEVLLVFLNTLWNSTSYQFEITEQLQCPNVTCSRFPTSRTHRNTCLHLPVNDQHSTLQQILFQYFSRSTGDNNYNCPRCHSTVQSTHHHVLTTLPKYFFFVLKRYHFHVQPDGSHSIQKVTTNIDIPVRLTMSQFIHYDHEHPHYKLMSVIHHHGENPNVGHYTCTAYEPDNGNWYHFNDQSTPLKLTTFNSTTDDYMLCYQQTEHEP